MSLFRARLIPLPLVAFASLAWGCQQSPLVCVPEGSATLLESTDTPQVAAKATTDRAEALIDALVELTALPTDGEPGHDDAYSQLIQMGFDAVPALIAHLDDERPTRIAIRTVGGTSSTYLAVRKLVRGILHDLAVDNLGTGWGNASQSYAADQADARAWWEKARKIGEESYLRTRVLPAGAKQAWPNLNIVAVIAKKYPQDLPAIYHKILEDYPWMESWPVAKAISSSSLPREQKVELFLHATWNRNLEHRLAAFWELKEYDPKLFVSLLIRTLDALPELSAGPFGPGGEGAFATLVLETDDSGAWESLRTVARRADVGLRLELLAPLGSPEGKQKTRQLALLAEFLDDATLRDADTNPMRCRRPFAGFKFPRLEVRNLAAMEMAPLLGIAVDPTPDWTPEQWAQLRQDVHEAYRKHAGEP